MHKSFPQGLSALLAVPKSERKGNVVKIQLIEVTKNVLKPPGATFWEKNFGALGKYPLLRCHVSGPGYSSNTMIDPLLF